MYMLFVWISGEADGGANDLEFVGTTLKDCKEALLRVCKVYESYSLRYHIYDVFENTIVVEGQR